MEEGIYQAPIAYIIFNRPEQTERSFATLRKQRPARLYIIADGPRLDYPSDIERCQKAREIVQQIDWPCEVHKNYAAVNMGLKNRVSSGLDWVFQNEKRAIVLEDDCVAHPDFFRFCDALLDRYADDERVSVVTGNNFQNGQRRGDASYYFSRYPHCWGWATWRRAWNFYQGDLLFWHEWRVSESWKLQMPDKIERLYWERIFDRASSGKIDSWSYPWTASVWYQGGLTATPNVNLVSNIGFGPEATHTTTFQVNTADLPIHPIGRVSHPETVEVNEEADRYVFEEILLGKRLKLPLSLITRLKRYLSTTSRALSEIVGR